MKVAFYNHTSEVSGAEISLLLTAKHMKKTKPVLFIPKGDLMNRAQSLGIETIITPSYRARLSKNPFILLKGLLGMLKAGYLFAKTIRMHDVDIIHANSLRAGMMASLFFWLHKRPILWHVRDNLPKKNLGLMIRFVSKKTTAATLCISEAIRNQFQSAGSGERLHLVHNGVALQKIELDRKIALRESIRDKFHTPNDSQVLVVIGQIAPWKRQEDAILALKKLQESGQDTYLWIVGEPKFREENVAYEQSLHQLVSQLHLEEKVHFAGFRTDVIEICCAADILVLCSENEPFGRVLIEAMSQSIPVVATNAGGVPEIVCHGEQGLLYPTGDVEELTRHISYLIHNPRLRKNMGILAEKRVREHFTIEYTVTKIESFYEQILEPSPKVAIVHDYLNQMGGAERVVSVLHEMFPQAPIYTTIVDRMKLLPGLRNADIRTTWMQYIPGILKRYKIFFWLYPFVVKQINVKKYDLVISSSSAYAKGVSVSKNALHLCYCHTPMRFAWDFSTYMEGVKVSVMLMWIAKAMQIPLRIWDTRRSQQVDYFIANSTIVQKRIQQCYQRHSQVIFPPVDVTRFHVSNHKPKDYFLIVSRLVSYKKIDIAVKACTRLQIPLVVIGEGPDRERLQTLAGPTIQFMGRLPDVQVVQFMQYCRAFIFPGLEDFGITPLEVNACGRPVIAYKGGGVLDTIKVGLNGMFFEQQTSDSLGWMLIEFNNMEWDSHAIRQHAEKFNQQQFSGKLVTAINQMVSSHAKFPIIKVEASRNAKESVST